MAMSLLFRFKVPVTLKSTTVMADIAVEDTLRVPVRFKSDTVMEDATRLRTSNVAELST